MAERGSRGVPIKAFELKVVGLDREGGSVGDHLGRKMCVYLNSSLMPMMSGNIEHLHHLGESSKSSEIHLNLSNAAASSVIQTIISSLSYTSSLPLLSILILLTHNQHERYFSLATASTAAVLLLPYALLNERTFLTTLRTSPKQTPTATNSYAF
jgi:hypothetical protein